MSDVNVVVLGAGVCGLTTAYLLSKSSKYSVTIIAKHVPGDYDIEYASPWAGANYMPFSKQGTKDEIYERNTWPELARLAEEVPDAGIHFQDAVLYNRNKDRGTPSGDFVVELMKDDPWYKDVVPNFRKLNPEELAPGTDSGIRFTSVCINTALYLQWLSSQCLKTGATIKRGIVKHVSEAASQHASGKQADIIVNCTGLSSLRLGGVEDALLYPVRGQTVLVRNDCGPMMATSGSDDAHDEFSYAMTRAAGGGCILGGCAQKNNWESQPDLNLANRIMRRCVELCPQLTNGGGVEALSVVRHGVGLRPYRQGGPRVEKEQISGIWTIHNYGHGSYGYQTSFGTAQAAVALVEEALHEIAQA